MTPSDTAPPDDIPADVAAALDDCSNTELRAVIHHAQQRLRERPPLTDAVEAREGEELVHTVDHGAYTIVVVERPDETGLDRGPFAYRVAWAPEIDGSGGKYRWHYLGRVYGETEGD